MLDDGNWRKRELWVAETYLAEETEDLEAPAVDLEGWRAREAV